MALNGTDVASYQSGIQPAKLTTTDFVIVKFTQGTNYTNTYAATQYSLSRKAGKLLGAYHYAAGGDAKKEAQYFVTKVGDRIGECVLALDWEGAQNGQFGKTDVKWCKSFLDEIYRLTGVRPLVYMSKSVVRAHDWSSVAKDYPLWCAQYGSNSQTDYQSYPWTDTKGFGAWKSDTIRQYSSKGRIKGYSGNLDLDKAYLTKAQWKAMAKGKTKAVNVYSRDAVVSEVKAHIGIKEGSNAHHKIIDRYNARTPLPRSYKVKYTDAWCATFVSYVAIVLGYTDIIPIECSCPRMIELAKAAGIWVEDDAYVPKPGDIILYDWQDSGKGDNTGESDHIGFVLYVTGSYMQIGEGNYKGAVGIRGMAVNGRFIRGYITPKYNANASEMAEFIAQTDSGPESAPELRKGSRNKKAVMFLQTVMGSGLTVDGDFGNNTERAVKDYQRSHALTPDGVVGPKTWTSLAGTSPDTKMDSKGRYVRALQIALGDLKVDGEFGQLTLAAVKEFQKKHGLTPDGIVGTKTWKALIKTL